MRLREPHITTQTCCVRFWSDPNRLLSVKFSGEQKANILRNLLTEWILRLTILWGFPYYPRGNLWKILEL